MHLVLFEDTRWPLFAPLSLSRPIFSLSSGSGTLLDRQLRILQPTRLTLWVRPGLVNFCRRHVLPKLKLPADINTPLDAQPALLVNARTLPTAKADFPTEAAVMLDGDEVLAAHTVSPGLAPVDALSRSDRWLTLRDLPRAASACRAASYLWDLLAFNEQSLRFDADRWTGFNQPKPAGLYHLVNPSAISLGQNVTLSPGVVLDASKGPIVIEAGAMIGANAVLFGPCHVGASATISPLALIRGETSVGTLCKIGGEVSNAIFMPCSNKAHEGFVGDSYIGEWVNFGAGANTSNLKNTYGEISVRFGQKTIPTGRQFLGSLVGDHTKFAIGTRLMTGSYIGQCCMIAASGLTPTFVPSFTFLTDQGQRPYDRAKAKETMTAVFHRRHREWEALDDQMLAYAAETASEVEGDCR